MWCFLGETDDFGVDAAAKLTHAVFLARLAGNDVGAAVDGNRYLRHQPSNTRSRRLMTASIRAATSAGGLPADDSVRAAARPETLATADSRRTTACSSRPAACSSRPTPKSPKVIGRL